MSTHGGSTQGAKRKGVPSTQGAKEEGVLAPRVLKLKNEGLGSFKPLWPSAVASGGSNSSKNQGISFCYVLTVVASGWSKSSKIDGIGFVKPLWPTVVASAGSKSSKIESLGFLKHLWPTIVASGGSKS